jgi:enoyl-CoA hydratase/carnithine racemase
MSDGAEVLLEKRDQSYWITINRPEKRNAINNAVIDGIREGYRLAHVDDDVRAIVLTASGDKAFCAGADLGPGKGAQPDFARPNSAYADLMRLAADATLPSIARVNGVCVAGGMGLLCMTDLAVAVEDARFGLPEVRVGLFPMQVLSLLRQLVPQRKLREWCFTGELFSAADALEAGLVNYLVPTSELDAKVNWLIDRLVDKSPTAIRRGRYALRAIEGMGFDQAIAYTETQIATMKLTEDAVEGKAAFNEKRAPQWTRR